MVQEHLYRPGAARNARAEKVRLAGNRVQELVESLRQEGLSDEEIHRLFEAELFYPALPEEND